MNLQMNYSKKQGSKLPDWAIKLKLQEVKKATLLKKARNLCNWDFEFRGKMGDPFLEAVQNEAEVLLCGAAGTGKSLRNLSFVNWVCWEYPGARILLVRKVRKDLTHSAMVTFERDVMGVNNPIVSNMKRTHRSSYYYPNGSEIVCAGMNNLGAALSAEYDIILAVEAVQFSKEDWEVFVMRLRSGVYPNPMVLGDTNPDRSKHWLKQRADSGEVLLLNTYHKDNPRYWDDKLEAWTQAGQQYVQGKLQRLTGVRRKRYLENKWVNSDGQIYDEWNDDIHLIDEKDLPPFVQIIRSTDFGFIHTFVTQWWGVDHDGRMYLFREIYETELLVEDAAKKIKALSEGEKVAYHVADHDAEDRATLKRHGIPTRKAIKEVQAGIQAVKERLRVQGDGKPRLFIVRDACVSYDRRLKEDSRPMSTYEEIGGYIWKSNSKKDEPVKEDDDGMDTLRYAVMALSIKRRGII